MTWLAAVRVVAITDRRRMVSPALLASGDWPAIARAFGDALARALDGVPRDRVAIQVREKDLDGGALLHLARAAVATGARVVVNDRADVAIAAAAHGVHLPERGLAVAEVRGLPGFTPRIVGVSRHAPGAVPGADLIQLGPIFATPDKGPPLGTDVLAGRTPATLVAVGGIDSPERARAAIRAGADAVAVIRAAWGAPGSLAAIVDALA